VEPIPTKSKSLVFFTYSYSVISGNFMRAQRFHLQPSTNRLSLVSIHMALVLVDNICVARYTVNKKIWKSSGAKSFIR
jgi:hypothetical protein